MSSQSEPLKEVPIVVDRLNHRGRGVGLYQRPHFPEKSVVEIISGLPGDEVLVELGKKRRGKYVGRLKQVITPSCLRVEPRCRHVPQCGGCCLQQMDYTSQLTHKEALVQKAFSPLLQAGSVDCQPIIPCAYPWNYRNKMEFTFSQNRAGERFLGLMIAGSKGHVLNLSECHLVSSWFLAVLQKAREWWEQSGLEAYRMNDTGSLRTLTVREGIRTQDKMVMLTVSGNPHYPVTRRQLHAFVEAMKSTLSCQERLSLFLRIHQLKKGYPTQFFEMHLDGPDHLLEKLTIDTGSKKTELTFKISPTSFFQPNSLQAEVLYSQALQMVSLPKRHVLDLYAGTATLGMAIALQAEQVTAIELNPHAVFDARSNQELNHIHNLQILCGDVGQKLTELKAQEGFVPPDLVVVDPPRTGLDQLALTHIISLNVPEILYISCNPATQALNIQELCQAGYALIALRPVDQFPHTIHIENIALLRRI